MDGVCNSEAIKRINRFGGYLSIYLDRVYNWISKEYFLTKLRAEAILLPDYSEPKEGDDFKICRCVRLFPRRT